MDDGNGNIFEARSGGPASEPAGNVGGDTVTGAIPAGRIDPAIALAASAGNNPSGGNGGSGSGDNTASRTGRGRHPNGCPCDNPKCVAKRQAPGSVEGSAPKPVKDRNIRAGFVEKTLQGIHLALVGITKCPEFTLDKDDAERLGKATADVLAYYKVKMTAKQEAYALLIEAAAQVYPPMLMSVYFRKKMEAEQRVKASPPKPPGMGHNDGPAMPKPAPNNVTPLVRTPNATPAPAFDPFNIRLDP